MLQELIKDAQWDQIFPHIVVNTEKSGSRGLLTRLIPCQDQQWRLDLQMLLASADRELARAADGEEIAERWVTVVAKRPHGASRVQRHCGSVTSCWSA